MAPEMFKDWAPQAYGIWTLVLMAIAYFAREWRETRKLSADDRQARREGFTWQVENLQTENRELRRELNDTNKEFTDYRRLCEDENGQLRKDLRHLEDKYTGLERRFDAQARSLPRVIDDRLKGSGK